MGRPRKRVIKKNAKPRKRVRKRASQHPVKKILGLLILLSIAILFVLKNPLSYSSIIQESETLHSLLADRIGERSGVISAIEKTTEERIKRGIRYKYLHYTLTLIPGVDPAKFWMGIEQSIPEGYGVKKAEPAREQEGNVFDVLVRYKRIEIAHIIFLHENVSTAPPVERAPPTVVKVSESVQVLQRAGKKEQGVVHTSSDTIAIIIDDIGNTDRYASLLFELPSEVAFSVLPQLSFSTYFSHEATKRGYDVMLHLPLEAHNEHLSLGPGGIYARMSDDEVVRILQENLLSVPDATWVNNHMGSLGTEDSRLMRLVIQQLQKKNMRLLDSKTSKNSVIETIGTECGMPYVRRNIFLDNRSDAGYIKAQLNRLIAHAHTYGYAIGIGHYRPATLQVLKEVLPTVEQQGVRLVRLRDIEERR